MFFSLMASCPASRGGLHCTVREGGMRTVLVVDCNSVRRPMSFFVLRDHHGDRQRLEAVSREREADVSAVVTGRAGEGKSPVSAE